MKRTGAMILSMMMVMVLTVTNLAGAYHTAARVYAAEEESIGGGDNQGGGTAGSQEDDDAGSGEGDNASAAGGDTVTIAGGEQNTIVPQNDSAIQDITITSSPDGGAENSTPASNPAPVTMFTVCFDANGHGTAPGAVSVADGECVGKPADLSADGFLFTGWYRDAGATSAWNFDADTVSGDITLYAGWTEVVPVEPQEGSTALSSGEGNTTPGGDSNTPSAITYTVTFDANGHGTAPDAVTVTEGETIQKPADPSADGYTFTGWYKDAAATDAWDFDADVVTGDLKLYAGWVEMSSRSTAKGDITTSTGAESNHENDTSASNEIISEENEATENITTASALSAPLQNGGLRAGQGVYLTLKYEGSGYVYASEYIGTVGTTVKIWAVPSDGYRFMNWEIVSGTGSIGAENNNLTTFTMGTTDATVKAVFEILPSTETSLAVEVEYGERGTASATANDPTTYTLTATPASGYEFDSWTIKQGSGSIDNENATSTTIKNCSGSVVVRAQFDKIVYPIFTKANPSEGGSTEGLPSKGGPALDVDLRATPNDGYVFKEWTITSGTGRITNPKEAFTVLTDITGEVTCQAEFEKIPSGQYYRVSVTKNFAELGEATANVPYALPGTKITLSATPASGYKFEGWEVLSKNVTLDNPNSATTTFTIASENVNVIAYFSFDDIYNVTTQTYGCGSVWTTQNQALSGSRVRLNATKPEPGWSFDHWEVVSGGVTLDNENALIARFVMRDQDVVVRAVFVPDATNPLREIKVTNPPKKDTYTAGESFDPDGMVVTAYYQNGSSHVTTGYTYSPTGMLAETEKNITISYTVNGVTKETTQAITVAPATLYAITYHLDYGTNHPSNPTTYTKLDTITLANPTRDGHTFGGWYDNAEFNGSPETEIPAGSSGDKQFFAKWTAETYSISYQNLKGASNSNPVTYTIADTPLTLADLTGGPTGYTFDGWYNNAAFSGNAITEIPANSTGDKTFYAKWTAVRYTVSVTNDGNGSGSANPAPVAQIKQNFDSRYYADTYADLKAAFGYDHDALWNHYVMFGKNEKRKVRFVVGINLFPGMIFNYSDRWQMDDVMLRARIPDSAYFDTDAYADLYPDLKAAFGYNHELLYRHYLKYGRFEGRKVFTRNSFNAKAYADRYADLKKAFGYDKAALWRHYQMFGKVERRFAEWIEDEGQTD